MVVGVDGSEHSKKALVEAIKITEKFKAETTLVSIFYPAPTPSAHQFSHRTIEDAKAVLEYEKVKYKLVSLTDNNPSKVIIDKAREEKSDLVVVGSKGAGAAHSSSLGSHYNRTACESPVNVLTAK
jgi:nucleotide-binding universal stress UspA family protein